MIKDQLRELRVRLDQMEQVALVIPTEYWPDAFDKGRDGHAKLDQDFSTGDCKAAREAAHRRERSRSRVAGGVGRANRDDQARCTMKDHHPARGLKLSGSARAALMELSPRGVVRTTGAWVRARPPRPSTRPSLLSGLSGSTGGKANAPPATRRR